MFNKYKLSDIWLINNIVTLLGFKTSEFLITNKSSLYQSSIRYNFKNSKRMSRKSLIDSVLVYGVIVNDKTFSSGLKICKLYSIEYAAKMARLKGEQLFLWHCIQCNIRHRDRNSQSRSTLFSLNVFRIHLKYWFQEFY
jgi:hypothetical protein